MTIIRQTLLSVVAFPAVLLNAAPAWCEVAKAAIESDSFNVEVNFEPAQLYAGNSTTDLNVVVSALSNEAPPLIRTTSDDGFMTQKRLIPQAVSRLSGFTTQKYSLRIEIHANANPAPHTLVLEFGSTKDKNAKPILGFAALPIGVVNNGQLTARIEEDSIDVGLIRGKSQFDILINNAFQAYDAYISRIDFKSDPGYLVELASIQGAKVQAGAATFDPPLIARAQTLISVPAVLHVNSPDLSGALRGLSKPSVSWRFTYSDGHGRQITDLKLAKDVKVPVAIGYALAAVGVGLLLGLFVAGVGRDSQSVRTMTANIAAALLIMLGVVSGHLEFSIFDAKWDFRAAVTLLILSAAAVIAGAPYLRRLLKLASNPAGGSPTPPGSALLLLAAGSAFLATERWSYAQPVPNQPQVANKAAARNGSNRPRSGDDAPIGANGLLQRGEFYLDAGNLDKAQTNFSQVTGTVSATDAERASNLLGTVYQRRYYELKEKNGTRDWGALYDAEKAYRGAVLKSSEQTGWAYLADSVFNIALIQIERGKTVAARSALKELEGAVQKDSKVHVYQLIWSSAPNTIIDADFGSAFLVAVLRPAVEGTTSVGPWSFSGLTNALKDQKVASAARANSTAFKPLVSLAVPHATAQETSHGSGTHTYNFSVSLAVPKDRRGEIKQVDYYFDHPSFKRNKNQTSTDATNNFSVHYEGWGALSKVDIKIVRKDGKAETMTFDMLSDLGWD